MNPESNMAIKLSELNQKVKSVITDNFPDPVWVIAEVSDITIHSTGHCYLELVEKDTKSDKLVAKARAIIWSFTFRMLKPYFETTTGYSLNVGIKVLVKATVEFHEIYGFSLTISDIDPTYTLGDIERKRQEIINRLEKEGVINMNKEIPLHLVPQKIAVISSETAAGYKDFVNQLEQNEYGYAFYPVLFTSIMQGDQAESSIVRTFERIYQYEDFFDVVVIIRGGGSKSDLGTFDNYNIAFHITQFPLPVLTGIGHEQDDTIADLVAHTRLKTPTAVADHLINIVQDFDNSLSEANNQLVRIVSMQLQDHQKQIDALSHRLSIVVQLNIQQRTNLLKYNAKRLETLYHQIFRQHSERIDFIYKKIRSAGKNMLLLKVTRLDGLKSSMLLVTKKYLEIKHHQMEMMQQRKSDMDPDRILNRGFSITLGNGKPLKDATLVNEGDTIETRLHKGKLFSRVKKTSHPKSDSN